MIFYKIFGMVEKKNMELFTHFIMPVIRVESEYGPVL